MQETPFPSLLTAALPLSFYDVHSKSPKPQKPRGKTKRVWDNGGTNTKELDYSAKNGDSPGVNDKDLDAHNDLVGPRFTSTEQVAPLLFQKNRCVCYSREFSKVP